MLQAEQLCARASPYVEAQAVTALREYASFLDSLQTGSGAEVRAKVEKLVQVRAEQSRGGKPTSSNIGFVPSDELNAYADVLQSSQRQSDSNAMRALAAAYQYSQAVYINRGLLTRQGKDPRGHC
jgi:hypothetical protein